MQQNLETIYWLKLKEVKFKIFDSIWSLWKQKPEKRIFLKIDSNHPEISQLWAKEKFVKLANGYQLPNFQLEFSISPMIRYIER